MARKPLSLLTAYLVFAASSVYAGWDEGVEAFKKGNFSVAESNFRELVDAQPEASQGHYMLGLSLLQQSKAGAAVAPLRRAVELSPDQLGYQLVVAQAELGSGDSQAAIGSLSKIDPGRVDEKMKPTWVQLLEKSTLEQPGRDSAALLEKAVAAAAEERRLWIALGRAAPDPERSFEAAAEAWRLDKKDDEIARWAVGKALKIADSKRGDERQDWYAKAADIAGSWVAGSPSADSHLYLGQSLMGQREYAAARKELLAATKAGGGAEAWFELGRCSLALKKGEDSLRELDTALTKNPSSRLTGLIHASRGAALRRLERFEEAGEAYGKAGLTNRVEEMARLAEMKEQNKKYYEELKACEKDLEEIEALEEENRALEGTSAWKEIERQRESVLRRCQHYFDAEAPPPPEG